MSHRLLPVDSGLISRYTESEFLDLVGYFDPDIVLALDRFKERQIRELEKLAGVEVVSVGTDGLRTLEFGSGTVALTSSVDEVRKLKKTGWNGCLSVVADFIREETDVRTLTTKIKNLDGYLDALEGHHEAVDHHVSELEAGKSYSKNGVEFHGVGIIDDSEGREVPSVELGNGLHESLSPEKVGIGAVPGVGRKTRNRLRRHGISTRRELIESDPHELMSIDGVGPYYAARFRAGAYAVENETPAGFGDNTLVGKDRVYVDIETDSLNPGVIWQIGVYDERESQYRYFIQDDDPSDAATPIREFAEWVAENARDATFVSWYGRNFDYPHLDSFVEKFCDRKTRDAWLEAEKTDLLMDVVKKSVAVPARSHKLEVVSERLGYERDKVGLTGGQAAQVYTRWMHGGEEPDWDDWISYCRDDVVSMEYIYHEIKDAERVADRGKLEKTYRSNVDPGNYSWDT